MAMLSSYTLLNRAPAPTPNFSPAAAAAATLQVRRKQLPPSAVASALRWASCKVPRRAPLFVCHGAADDKGDKAQAQGDTKYVYDIQPSALQNAPKSELARKDWSVMGDEDVVILKFRVGELPKDKTVEVRKTEDKTHLVIKYTGDTSDDTQASKLNVQLALPPGYPDKVQARWFEGWLVILIARPNKHGDDKIEIRPDQESKPPAQ